MKLVVFVCLLFITNGFQPSQFTFSQAGYRFQPANNVELIFTFSNTRTSATCAIHCYQNILCRTFDFDSSSHQCRLFEGSVNTGTLISTVITTLVGWIEMDASMFTLYNATSDQCINNRFLYSDPISGRCECPTHTFYDGSMCLNQRFAGDTCTSNSWCRTDLNINCIASICVGPTTPSMPSTTVTSYTSTTVQILSSHTMISTTASTTSVTSATTAVATCTTLINFNDIPGASSTSGIIPNGYKNLNWINAGYINVSTTPSNSGYRAGVSTMPFVMYNPTGGNLTITSANGTRFSFDAVWLTSAWRNPMNIVVDTFSNGWITSGGQVSLSTTYQTKFSCGFCTNTDTITFYTDGSIGSNLTQNGTQFIIGKLCISFGH
ncbi:unnamed protein product [Adineta steineri]|uniref:Apple domain-containing protein n=1 Tax=Adineta steineri TaxID=433720 RepID=A0A815D143_9BILA|nr:unnamed protein product [Adineta steineri]CAF3754021.1 unnamed protein product [Adineta steineri]